MSEERNIYREWMLDARRERDEARARLAEIASMARNSRSGMLACSVILDIVARGEAVVE